MSDRSTDPLVPMLIVIAFGIGGIAGALAEWRWLMWIGIAGFVVMVLWLILTGPSKDKGKGDGGGGFFWGDFGDSGGSDGGGGGGGE